MEKQLQALQKQCAELEAAAGVREVGTACVISLPACLLLGVARVCAVFLSLKRLVCGQTGRRKTWLCGSQTGDVTPEMKSHCVYVQAAFEDVTKKLQEQDVARTNDRKQASVVVQEQRHCAYVGLSSRWTHKQQCRAHSCFRPDC